MHGLVGWVRRPGCFKCDRDARPAVTRHGRRLVGYGGSNAGEQIKTPGPPNPPYEASLFDRQ
jgi:hypothetical protein